MTGTRALTALLCVTLAAIGGCNRPQNKFVDPVAVTTEDGSQFPASLAGRWTADQHGWEFVFDPNGRISSAVISLGRVTVLPGQTTTVPTRTGEQATFTPGPWAVHYDPALRMLTVKIAMTHVRLPMGPHVLEGSSIDGFSGFVSPTMDAWQTEWTTFPRYTARIGETQPVELAVDATYGETQSLVFVKTADQ